MEDQKKINNEEINSIDELFHRSLLFKNTTEYFKLFTFIGKIHHYSHYNALLVYMQNPNVQFFATAGYWKSAFKRTVTANARPYVIIRPFAPADLAYDVNDTDGKLSPQEFIDEGLRGGLFKVTGHLEERIYYELIENLIEYKIFVNEVFLNFAHGGQTNITSQGHINIELSKTLSIPEKFAVLIHELAHNFLGHLGNQVLVKETEITKGKNKGRRKRETVTIAKRSVSSSMEEIEAETVSFVICARWNLEKFPYVYLSAHITEENIKKVSVSTIVKIADQIETLFLSKFKD